MPWIISVRPALCVCVCVRVCVCARACVFVAPLSPCPPSTGPARQFGLATLHSQTTGRHPPAQPPRAHWIHHPRRVLASSLLCSVTLFQPSSARHRHRQQEQQQPGVDQPTRCNASSHPAAGATAHAPRSGQHLPGWSPPHLIIIIIIICCCCSWRCGDGLHAFGAEHPGGLAPRGSALLCGLPAPREPSRS